jgi:rhodanese-related sulfurtransferase
LTLPDETEVYPAHGAGSMCGKNMSKETSSTIGEQRQFNYALKPMTREQFVQLMTADLPEAPAYFPKDAEINRSGARRLSEISQPKPFTAAEVAERSADVILLDVRSADEFGSGHIPGSLNIGLGGQFAIWAGSLIPLTAKIVIVAATNAQVDEAVMRLARVGIENVIGFLKGGIESWRYAGQPVATVPQVTVHDLKQRAEKDDLQILDVRRPTEYQNGHVPRAISEPLATLERNISRLPLKKDMPTAVICAGGYRSSAATSVLQKFGFTNLVNITGGTSAWINAGYEVEI